jgi:hypothetical protein
MCAAAPDGTPQSVEAAGTRGSAGRKWLLKSVILKEPSGDKRRREARHTRPPRKRICSLHILAVSISLSTVILTVCARAFLRITLYFNGLFVPFESSSGH